MRQLVVALLVMGIVATVGGSACGYGGGGGQGSPAPSVGY